jgi:hypothetical protein
MLITILITFGIAYSLGWFARSLKAKDDAEWDAALRSFRRSQKQFEDTLSKWNDSFENKKGDENGRTKS